MSAILPARDRRRARDLALERQKSLLPDWVPWWLQRPHSRRQRIALMRHGRGTAAALGPRARTLRRRPSASSIERRGRSCRRCPKRSRAPTPASARRSRWVCHGASDKGSPSSAASFFRDQQSPVAKRGKRAGGSAELQRERFAAKPLQADARTVQGGGIFRKLEAERHRAVHAAARCAPRPRFLAMLLRKPGKSRSSAGRCP